MGLAEMRAKRAAAQAAVPTPAPEVLTGTSAAPCAPVPAPVAPPQRGGLDFNDEVAVPKFDEKTPQIPWNTNIQAKLELIGLVHVTTDAHTFYKATVKVLSSNHDKVQAGQTWSLLYFYTVNPKINTKEEWGNNASKRDMRKLAAALSGEDIKNQAFDANKVLGDLQKETVAANGVSLKLPFNYEQQGYISKKGDQRYASIYSYAD